MMNITEQTGRYATIKLESIKSHIQEGVDMLEKLDDPSYVANNMRNTANIISEKIKQLEEDIDFLREE